MISIGISVSPTKSQFGPLLFSGDLFYGLEQVKKYGYEGVELSLLDSQRIDQDAIMKKIDQLGLCVFAVATGQTFVTEGCGLYSCYEEKRKKALERLFHHIDFAVRLNCKVIIGGIRGKVEDECDNFAETLRKGNAAVAECVKYGEQKGVTLLIEPINRYESNVINRLDQGIELIHEIESDHLKLLPDTYHMNIEEPSLEKSIEAAGSFIGYIHFADSNRMAPGWGHIDFCQIIGALKKIDYSGHIGVEILPQPDHHQAAQQAIQFLRGVVDF
ncbi:MAG: TIM barrel protein [Desulfobacterales bacterium]